MVEMNNQNMQKKSVRGFAAMDAEKQREIARKGGRAAHEQGVAHEWSSQEAREAGKKGGQSRGRRNKEDGPLL
jgi:general stress protein YciG